MMQIDMQCRRSCIPLDGQPKCAYLAYLEGLAGCIIEIVRGDDTEPRLGHQFLGFICLRALRTDHQLDAMLQRGGSSGDSLNNHPA